ncbi:MAG: substrate-binding domain-containing protein [Comamonas sp.]
MIQHPLLDMLEAIARQGSISGAARALGLSYRNVWGALKKWETQLGQELILWGKGHTAQLSPFGLGLLMSERQAQARLAPHIEAIQAELGRSFALNYGEDTPVLALHASYDSAYSLLRQFASTQGAQSVHLDLTPCVSVEALRALHEGRAALAGFHVLEGASKHSMAAHIYKPLLDIQNYRCISLGRRSQGLIVARGNPLRLHSLQDVAERRARFVNRPLGTGTRVVLADLMTHALLQPEDICGFDDEEPSHNAAAQVVAQGQADVCLGIASAAQAKELDFVPLCQEYDLLVCHAGLLQHPALQNLHALLHAPQWQQKLQALGGHDSQGSGQIMTLPQCLPWWSKQASKGVPASPVSAHEDQYIPLISQ